MTLDVLCVGVATIDLIARVDVMPGGNDRVLSAPFVRAGGGPAATAAVTLARLGRSVGFCGVVGDDAAGVLARASLEQEGVDTSWLVTRSGVTTPESMVVVSGTDAHRAIITTGSVGPDPTDVPTDAATWIHVDQVGYAPTRQSQRTGRGSALLSIDGGNRIPGLDLVGVDLYAPTRESLTELFPRDSVGEQLRAATAAGSKLVVATAGASGTWILEHDKPRLISSFDVQAVSTMGAGDVFHGALLAGLLRGDNLAAATRFANAVAALSCGALDGRSGIPTAPTADKFLTTMTAASR